MYLKTDEEVVKITKKYTEKEALNNALQLAYEKVAKKINYDDKILSQKILQNKVIDSKMEVDIFIITEEEISSQTVIRKGVENDI